MRIKRKLDQHRRDFTAIYICENCDHEEEKGGYDDGNFHRNVVPGMKCKKCGKSQIDLGLDTEQIETKYPDWMTI